MNHPTFLFFFVLVHKYRTIRFTPLLLDDIGCTPLPYKYNDRDDKK